MGLLPPATPPAIPDCLSFISKKSMYCFILVLMKENRMFQLLLSSMSVLSDLTSLMATGQINFQSNFSMLGILAIMGIADAFNNFAPIYIYAPLDFHRSSHLHFKFSHFLSPIWSRNTLAVPAFKHEVRGVPIPET